MKCSARKTPEAVDNSKSLDETFTSSCRYFSNTNGTINKLANSKRYNATIEEGASANLTNMADVETASTPIVIAIYGVICFAPFR